MKVGERLITTPTPVRGVVYFQSLLTFKQLIWHLQSLLAKTNIHVSFDDAKILLQQGVSQLTKEDLRQWGQDELPYAQARIIVQSRVFAYNIDLSVLPTIDDQMPTLSEPGKLIFLKTDLEFVGSTEAVAFDGPCSSARLLQDR